MNDLKGKNNQAERENNDLIKKVVRSGTGLLFSRISAYILDFLRFLVLSFFLTPKEFGVVAFSVLLSTTIHYFSEFGLEYALIQKKGEIESYLNTSWTFNVIRGGIIAFTLIIMSPGIPLIFFSGNTPQELQNLTISIFIFAIFSFLRDAKNIGIVYLRKSLQFKKIIIGDLFAQGISFFTAIMSLFFIQSYIVLLISYSCLFISEFIISYVIHPFRPRFSLKIIKLKDLLGFSKWIFLSMFLVFAITQLYGYIVGIVIGLASLGLYQLANQIAIAPSNEIAQVVSQVSFPSFASIQDKSVLLKNGVIKSIEVISFISLPFCFLLLVFSKDVVILIMTPAWHPIIPIIQLLSVGGCVQSLDIICISFFNAIGQPALNTKTHVLNVIIMCSLVFPLMQFFGLLGVCISFVTAGFSTFLVRFSILKRIAKFYWWEAIRNVFFLISLLALTGLIHTILNIMIFVEKNIYIIILQLLIATAIFCVSGLLLEKKTSFRFLTLIFEIKKAAFRSSKNTENL